MKSIKIACAGFPVGQRTYRSRLSVVELVQMHDGLPRPDTVARWRADSGDKFEFIACMPEDITHRQAKNSERGGHRLGLFQDTPEVHGLFRRTVMAATALQSKILFVRVPRTVAPHADNVDRFIRFFKKADRGTLTLVWEPPTIWPASIVSAVTKVLGLVTAVNPLSTPPPPGQVKYFRLGAAGKTGGIHSFTDQELARVKDACDGTVSYVVFNNGPRSFDDAVRFASMIY